MSVFSKLMLGTVQFGLNYGVANTAGKPSFDTVKDILKTAYEGGVTTLDTAPEYGDSEEVIGCALPAGADPEQFMENSIRMSLQRLQQKSVAAVLLHAEKDSLHLDALKKQKDRGLTEFAGISLNLQAHADDGETADCLQVPASILDHRFDHCFGKPGRHCFIRGAYMQGMLLMPEDKIFIPEVLERRRRLEKLGIPMAELALRYLFSKPENKSILTGVETVAQLRENIRISRLSPLNETDLKRIDEIVFPPLPENCVSPFFWGKYKKEHNIA